jgi:hypothetical protein
VVQGTYVNIPNNALYWQKIAGTQTFILPREILPT